MKLNIYIATSLVFHLLLMSLLGMIRPVQHTPISAIKVSIADPAILKPQPEKHEIPNIKKKKPVIIKRRRRTPQKNVKPDSIFGESGIQAAGQEEKHAANEPGNIEGSGHVKDNSSEKPTMSEEGIRSQGENSSGSHAYLFDKKIIEKYAKKGLTPKKGLSFDTSEFRNRGYMRMLKEKIEDIWKYPKDAARLGISGDLYIKFTIKKDGMLENVELVRTSGYRSLDEAAIKALKDAEPFWPLPDDWEKDVLEINGHFIYIFGTTYVM